jgi:hypothetical protein
MGLTARLFGDRQRRHIAFAESFDMIAVRR